MILAMNVDRRSTAMEWKIRDDDDGVQRCGTDRHMKRNDNTRTKYAGGASPPFCGFAAVTGRHSPQRIRMTQLLLLRACARCDGLPIF